MEKYKLDILISNQLLLIKTGIELTASASVFRSEFKSKMNLPKNTSHKDILFYIGAMYKNNGIFNDFVKIVKRNNMSHLLDEVTYTTV